VDDRDGGFVGDGDDAFADVLGADAEVVHLGGAAQARLSARVDVVVSHAEVADGLWSCRECFRGGARAL
jgi:hypothetical protein